MYLDKCRLSLSIHNCALIISIRDQPVKPGKTLQAMAFC